MKVESPMIPNQQQQPETNTQVEVGDISVDEATVGIDIVSLPISSPTTNSPTSDRDNSFSPPIQYVVWDFAGQIEYSTLHPVSIIHIHSFIFTSPDAFFYLLKEGFIFLMIAVLPVEYSFSLLVGGGSLKEYQRY